MSPEELRGRSSQAGWSRRSMSRQAGERSDTCRAKTWVKVCGIRRPQDLVAAAEAGADAVGMVFASRSKRRISPADAKLLVELADDAVTCVGVFMDQPASEVAAMVDRCGLRAVQYYGPWEEFVSIRESVHELDLLIWGVRLGAGFACGGAHEAVVAALADPSAAPDAVLFDSVRPGSGERYDFGVLARYSGPLPFVVAGGLGPDNVSEVVCSLRPWGVDASSSLELRPGVKDGEAIARFVEAVRLADSIRVPSSLTSFGIT